MLVMFEDEQERVKAKKTKEEKFKVERQFIKFNEKRASFNRKSFIASAKRFPLQFYFVFLCQNLKSL